MNSHHGKIQIENLLVEFQEYQELFFRLLKEGSVHALDQTEKGHGQPEKE